MIFTFTCPVCRGAGDVAGLSPGKLRACKACEGTGRLQRDIPEALGKRLQAELAKSAGTRKP